MPDAFRQLFVWTHQKGFQSADTPLAVFFNVPGQVPDDELLWEVQLPIAGGVAPGGPDKQGLGVRLLPEAEMASTMHRGSYSTLEEAYKALTAWLTEHGYEVVGPPEEIYLQGPGKFSAKDFLTEVRFPVRKGQGILGFAKP
jgi:effector-binding domain-containing protein